jgi:hypothetical protein
MLSQRIQYSINGGVKMSLAMLRGTFLLLALAAFGLLPAQAYAQCDPADPECRATEPKNEKPKKPSSNSRKPKRNTNSGDVSADQGSQSGEQAGNAPKSKKQGGGQEQITEENKQPAAGKRASSGRPAHVNPVEFDKATGKHCSGQDEYRVCW